MSSLSPAGSSISPGDRASSAGLLSFFTHPFLTLLAPIGTIRFVTAMVWLSLCLALRRSTWTATVREVLAKQIYFTGVGAMSITCVGGLMVGISVIAQAGVWLDRFDQSAFFGPLVVNVVVQNLGPLLVNFFVIGRSGTAISTELANMAVHHEVEVLDSQGVDPFIYLVMPRVIGMAISVLCLTILFVTVALLGGYLFGIALQVPALDGGQFANGVFHSLRPTQMLLFLAKTMVPALVTGSICCMYGLRVEPVLTAVPQAGTRAVVASVWAMFALSALTSLIALV